MNYSVDFQGMYEDLEADTLEEAKAEIDEMIGYSQENIYILDYAGNEKAYRRWNRTLDGIEDCENPIQFGDYGYFGDWEDLFYGRGGDNIGSKRA